MSDVPSSAGAGRAYDRYCNSSILLPPCVENMRVQDLTLPIEALKPLSPSSSDSLNSLKVGVADDILKRPFLSIFLTHEKKRDVRRKQQHTQRELLRSKATNVLRRSLRSQLPTWGRGFARRPRSATAILLDHRSAMSPLTTSRLIPCASHPPLPCMPATLNAPKVLLVAILLSG